MAIDRILLQCQRSFPGLTWTTDPHLMEWRGHISTRAAEADVCLFCTGKGRWHASSPEDTVHVRVDDCRSAAAALRQLRQVIDSTVNFYGRVTATESGSPASSTAAE